MAQFPNSLEEAIAQSREATLAALEAGCTRLSVNLQFTELKQMPVALQFLPVFEQLGIQPKISLPTRVRLPLPVVTGQTVSFQIDDVGTSRTPVERKILPEDEAFLLVAPSAVEVAQVEKMANLAGDRPFILLNPQLEDVSIIGIGYAARQLRDRFLGTIESCYYLRPLQGAAVLRSYPSLWQVWLETNDEYQLIAEVPQRPAGEELDRILAEATSTGTTDEAVAPKKPGFLTNLQRFLNALSR
jgi:hypothetical protein